jgi:hypothetical protein
MLAAFDEFDDSDEEIYLTEEHYEELNSSMEEENLHSFIDQPSNRNLKKEIQGLNQGGKEKRGLTKIA